MILIIYGPFSYINKLRPFSFFFFLYIIIKLQHLFLVTPRRYIKADNNITILRPV